MLCNVWDVTSDWQTGILSGFSFNCFIILRTWSINESHCGPAWITFSLTWKNRYSIPNLYFFITIFIRTKLFTMSVGSISCTLNWNVTVFVLVWSWHSTIPFSPSDKTVNCCVDWCLLDRLLAVRFIFGSELSSVVL